MNNIISRINESYDWIKSKAVAAYEYGTKEIIESFVSYDDIDIFRNENTISQVNFIVFLFCK